MSMWVIFDWTCDECGEKREYMTRNGDTPPEICKACNSTTATFTKHITGPKWIEGDTPGSKPPSHGKNKTNIQDPKDLYR